MDVNVKNKRQCFRLILAGAIAPSVPMLALAITMWKESGSIAWFSLVFLFGYLFFFLFGFPVIAVLLRSRSVRSYAVGGGGVAIMPILLLILFSGPSSNKAFAGNMLFDLMLLFGVGAIGGILFWSIAFSGSKVVKD